MDDIPRIDHLEARTLLDEKSALFVDIRDPMSHRESHIDGCFHLTMQSMDEFLKQTDRSAAIVVYCYHGNSSLGATDYLMEQGFKNVRSLDGGFESFRALHPDCLKRGGSET